MAAHQRINWGSMAGRRRARAVRSDDQPELPLRATLKKRLSGVLEPAAAAKIAIARRAKPALSRVKARLESVKKTTTGL